MLLGQLQKPLPPCRIKSGLRRNYFLPMQPKFPKVWTVLILRGPSLASFNIYFLKKTILQNKNYRLWQHLNSYCHNRRWASRPFDLMSLGIAVFHREFKKVGLCAYNMGYQDEPRPKAYSARYTQQQNPHLVFDFKVLPGLFVYFRSFQTSIVQYYSKYQIQHPVLGFKLATSKYSLHSH